MLNTKSHNFTIGISAITFDFSEYDWEDDFSSEEEWIAYQADLTQKYSTYSIYFEEYDLPELPEEDETIEEFYEANHNSETGHYYRILESWIDEEIGWLFKNLEYSVKKE